MSIPVNQRRFAVDKYYSIADTGVLATDERVELLGR